MKLIVLMSAIALALAGNSATAAPAGGKSTVRASQQKSAAKKREACEEAMRAETNAAMLGSALGMVGSLGGLAGRGGALAGQIASTAGDMVAREQSASARAGVTQKCY